MDTDYAVPTEVDRVRARVAKIVETDGGVEEVETWVRVFPLSSDEPAEANTYHLPATFAVLPSASDIDREVVIELEAIATNGNEVLVTRRLRTGFVPGQARLVRMLIHRSCAEISCPEGDSCGCPGASSCATPSCVDQRVSPESLETIDDPALLPPDSEFPIAPGDGGVPDSGVPDGGIECEPPLVLCNQECVNTATDLRYCGGCNNACPNGFVCEASVCRDLGDCRAAEGVCTGFTYCDDSTGNCLRGCANDDQCVRNQELCDVAAHECVCTPDFERCAFDCVDTQSDPRFCGGCETFCEAGEVCEVGICLDPGDCRSNGFGCSGFTYCDEATGDCLRGCEETAQCTGKNQVCDTSLHECVCDVDFHECDGVCVSSLDAASCGTSCTPCLFPPDAIPICALGVCDFVCTDGFERCDDRCCPTSCPPGEVLFEQACASVHVRTVDDQGDVGEYTSIALDAAGQPHIAYYGRNGKKLLYSVRPTGGPWSQEVAESPGDVGKYASLAIDSAGNPQIAHYEEGGRDLLFARREVAGTWTQEIVSEKDDVGEYASLAFDANGTAQIAFYDKSNKDLMFATELAGGAWSTQTVYSDGGVGKFASLAFDPNGTAHIAFYDETNKDLMIATRLAAGVWFPPQRVYGEGDVDVGKFASLAFDANGTAKIAFYDETNKDLMLATKPALGAWSVQTVDSLGDVGEFASLAIDASGTTHMSYFDATGLDLKHAVQKPGQVWSSETIDSAGEVGQYTSIAIDAEGHAHISYYDKTNTNLKYALVAGN